jgi:hypothetical protein
MKTHEPVPSYREGDTAHYTLGGKTRKCIVLKIDTYCCSTDRFREEAHYSILDSTNALVYHNIPESELGL